MDIILALLVGFLIGYFVKFEKKKKEEKQEEDVKLKKQFENFMNYDGTERGQKELED